MENERKRIEIGTGEFKVVKVTITDDGRYQCVLRITDTAGQKIKLLFRQVHVGGTLVKRVDENGTLTRSQFHRARSMAIREILDAAKREGVTLEFIESAVVLKPER